MSLRDLITGVKISSLPSATSLHATDVLAGVQGMETKKFSLSAIIQWIRTYINPAEIGAVPDTREINGHELSQDVTLTASDVGAQEEITASGILKGDGAGGVSAAAAGTDYQTPLVAGTDYATPAMIPTVPSPSDATPQALGTAAAGSSGDYSRDDHVHEKPTYSASDVGLENVDNVRQYSATNPPPYPVTSVNGSTGAVTVSVPGAYASNPTMDGTASPGSSGAWARGDHVHPSDTGKANQAELATEETGSTASKPYAVGDCFCWNGNLYWAKTAIAAGASFEEGTNCETKTVASLPGAVLVWSNPNMSSSFAAQSINVDLSRFTRVHIVFKADVNDAAMDDAEMIVDGNTHTVARFTLPPSGSSSIGISRAFIPSGSGIDVKEGLSKTLLNGTRSTNNVKVVPLRVYGVF